MIFKGMMLTLGIFTLLGLMTDSYVVWIVYHHYNDFHSTVCQLIDQSRVKSAQQAQYYQQHYQLAIDKSKLDTGAARTLDRRSAAEDLHLYQQYLVGAKFHFPGCA